MGKKTTEFTYYKIVSSDAYTVSIHNGCVCKHICPLVSRKSYYCTYYNSIITYISMQPISLGHT